jgi:hypothetical protein
VFVLLLLLLLLLLTWLPTNSRLAPSCCCCCTASCPLLFLPLLLLLLLLWFRVSAEPLAVHVAQLDHHTAGKHTPGNCRSKTQVQNNSNLLSVKPGT